MLKQKAVVITGSTSGIGLGMARAFAAQGASIMLNGLGDAKEIEAVRAAIESEFDVEARYSPTTSVGSPSPASGAIVVARRVLP